MKQFAPPSPALSTKDNNNFKTEPFTSSLYASNLVQTIDNNERYSTPPCPTFNESTPKMYQYATPMASPPLLQPSNAAVLAKPRPRSQRLASRASTAPSSKMSKVGKRKPPSKSGIARSEGCMIVPLSAIVSKFPNVEKADIEAFVNRGYNERHAEVRNSKKPGKVKRPMNAFMLYRKAFQNLAKVISTEINHQVVSQICGDSWSIETMAIRDKFNRWAQIERAKHQEAHPDYKFSPSKNATAPAENDDNEVDAEGDLDVDTQEERKQSLQSIYESPSKQRTDRLQQQMSVPSLDASFASQSSYYQPTDYSNSQSFGSTLQLAPAPMFQNIYGSIPVQNNLSSMYQQPTIDYTQSFESTNSQMEPALSFSQSVIDPQMLPAEDSNLQAHSYFEECVFPYGADSMTVLDSMMNLDPQMDYLSSSWEQEL